MHPIASLIEISLADQCLRLTTQVGQYCWPISSALKGAGEQQGSEQTPRGWHRIVAKIGADLPLNAVLVGRRPTGEIYSAELAQAYPHRDWILTRILWLQGLEIGRNRFGTVDSQKRFIYIHGTPDTEPMGEPRSHGCIRMRNQDVLELFELVGTDTKVWIGEESLKNKAETK